MYLLDIYELHSDKFSSFKVKRSISYSLYILNTLYANYIYLIVRCEKPISIRERSGVIFMQKRLVSFKCFCCR